MAQIIGNTKCINGNPHEGVALAVPFEDGMLSISIGFSVQGDVDIIVWKCSRVGTDGALLGKKYGYRKIGEGPVIGPIYPNFPL